MTRILNRSDQREKRRSLRSNMPPAEQILWSKLKGRQVGGARFRRQYSVGHYVLDFYCPEIKLAIEIDGESHFRPEANTRDQERQRFVECFGIRFLRFQNDKVHKNLEGVIGMIEKTIKQMGKERGSPSRKPPRNSKRLS